MCLAVPGKVEEMFEADGLKMAKINFGGIRRSVCLEYTPEVVQGDYVLVHVGFAISVIDEQEAKRTYELLRLTGDIEESIVDPQTLTK
jgi:hydrogenase expression/formation protein HypC